jgi:hypothetical protein
MQQAGRGEEVEGELINQMVRGVDEPTCTAATPANQCHSHAGRTARTCRDRVPPSG